MVDKCVEEKVKVNNFFELLNVPLNSWVEINGNDEFRVSYPSLRRVTTLSAEEDYICMKHYSACYDLSKPIRVEKLLKGTGGDAVILKFSRMIEGDKE
jgi:hypothetical protein